MLEINIRNIPPKETAWIRYKVLWPSIPLESQILPFDTLPSTLHFGAFLLPTSSDKPTGSEQLIGCLTVVETPYPIPTRLNPELLSKLHGLPQFQLRKFGVLEQYQSKGIGRQLLEGAIKALQAKNRAMLLHFDAREKQIGFYERSGFELLQDDRFEKRGPTGQGPSVIYVRMGKIIE